MVGSKPSECIQRHGLGHLAVIDLEPGQFISHFDGDERGQCLLCGEVGKRIQSALILVILFAVPVQVDQILNAA